MQNDLRLLLDEGVGHVHLVVRAVGHVHLVVVCPDVILLTASLPLSTIYSPLSLALLGQMIRFGHFL
jgi:hypothetical protein